MVTVVAFPRPAAPALKPAAPALNAVEESLSYYTPERAPAAPRAETALDQMYGYYSAA